MANKIQVMIESNSYNLVTGYSRVVREIMFRLAKDEKYEVFHIGQQYSGMPVMNNGVTIFPLIDSGKSLRQYWVDRVKPDYYLWIEDSFTMTAQEGLNLNLYDGKLVLYIPHDGENCPTTGIPMMKRADKIVAMTDFGKEVMEKDGFNVDAVIYHGVDTDIYKPASKIQKLKIKSKFKFNSDDRIILYIARNSPRKLPQLNIDIVAKFLIKHPKAKYLIHMPDFTNPSTDLVDYIQRCLPIQFGNEYKDLLSKQIFFSPLCNSLNLGAQDSEIAQLYQVADIYATFASGEGFGFPLIEAAATEVPVVATDYTTTHELTVAPKCGLASKPISTWANSFNVRHAIPDVEASVKDLEKVYCNQKLAEDMGSNGRAFVKDKCDWDKIAEQWKEVFK